jgi:hypothetical protein
MKLVAMCRLRSSSYAALLTAGVCLAINVPGAATAASNKSNQIRVDTFCRKIQRTSSSMRELRRNVPSNLYRSC